MFSFVDSQRECAKKAKTGASSTEEALAVEPPKKKAKEAKAKPKAKKAIPKPKAKAKAVAAPALEPAIPEPVAPAILGPPEESPEDPEPVHVDITADTIKRVRRRRLTDDGSKQYLLVFKEPGSPPQWTPESAVPERFQCFFLYLRITLCVVKTQPI